MIYISSDLHLTADPEIDLNAPIFGWHSVVTPSNVAATGEDDDHPVSNLGNVSTAAFWRADDADDHTVTVTTGTTDDIDYVGIARHNFGSQAIAVKIEAREDTESAWEEIGAEVMPGDDAPMIFRFPADGFQAVRVVMQEGNAPPEIGVLYVGKILTSQRRIYVGHVPIQMGRETQVISGRSESGNFLGRIITGETLSTNVELTDLTPAWVRENMLPFLRQAQRRPFFFGWRPVQYPAESGFAWLNNDPRPVNSRANGMMNVELQLSGIA